MEGSSLGKTIDVLNRQIANWTVLYMKLHHYHWHVAGPQFFTLHEKFEALYEEAASHIDELAERVLALNGQPVSKLVDCLKLAVISEATGGETAEQMVQTLVNDFSTLLAELKEGMKAAQQEGDEGTSDMLLGIHKQLEQHLWMLRAFLR